MKLLLKLQISLSHLLTTAVHFSCSNSISSLTSSSICVFFLFPLVVSLSGLCHVFLRYLLPIPASSSLLTTPMSSTSSTRNGEIPTQNRILITQRIPRPKVLSQDKLIIPSVPYDKLVQFSVGFSKKCINYFLLPLSNPSLISQIQLNLYQFS